MFFAIQFCTVHMCYGFQFSTLLDIDIAGTRYTITCLCPRSSERLAKSDELYPLAWISWSLDIGSRGSCLLEPSLAIVCFTCDPFILLFLAAGVSGSSLILMCHSSRLASPVIACLLGKGITCAMQRLVIWSWVSKNSLQVVFAENAGSVADWKQSHCFTVWQPI